MHMLTRGCGLTLAAIGVQVLAIVGVSAVANAPVSVSASPNDCPKCSITIEWESVQVNKSTEDNAMERERYRIHWKSLKTGATGHGTGLFSRSEAQKIADNLNRENDGLLVHWIEPVGGLEPELKSEPESEPLTPMECPTGRKCV